MASSGSEAMVSNEMGDLDGDSLVMHRTGRPGKIEIIATKPLVTQRDLALAYSPGVAAPCLEIAKDPDTAYDYTARGNLVAVISNGTAVLGLGDIGALASKPVMEGKAVLFKRFADVDCMDIEVDTKEVDEFVNCVRFLGPTFGGINLEDIKAPECFIIEQRLRELMDIPIFHDDQHGTAIVSAAGLINALHLTGRNIKDIKMVVNGAGAASIACIELVKAMGMPHENAILCDTKGVIWQGRTEGMNQWKSAHAVRTKARTLEEAMKGADVFFGLSVKGAVTKAMVKSMADKPIIFAMANPDPEITPEDVRSVRKDAIIATGRSDYANQINNVLGFPYIFRGALDVRARTINEEMKVAAAEALAKLAREDVPDEVDRAYSGRRLRYGPEYVVPVPFDPRLISTVSAAVAQAAMDSGVARRTIPDMAEYRRALAGRLDPTSHWLQSLFEQVKANPQRIVFAEGEEERTIRAAVVFRDNGYGTPILIGREELVRETMKGLGITEHDRHGDPQCAAVDAQRALHRPDLQAPAARRLPAPRRAAHGQPGPQRVRRQHGGDGRRRRHGDRHHPPLPRMLRRHHERDRRGARQGADRLLDRGGPPRHGVPGRHLDQRDAEPRAARHHCQADGAATPAPWATSRAWRSSPSPTSAAARSSASTASARRSGSWTPRRSTSSMTARCRPTWRSTTSCCARPIRSVRLTGPANVLIMPGLHSAHISSRLMQRLGGVTVIGPVIDGLQKPMQIVQMGATVSDLVNHAALAAYGALKNGRRD